MGRLTVFGMVGAVLLAGCGSPDDPAGDDVAAGPRAQLDRGDHAKFAAAFSANDAEVCREAGAAFTAKFADASPADPAFVAASTAVVAVTPSDAGRDAVLELLPVLLKADAAALPDRCKPLVVAGLTGPAGRKRLAARLALHPKIDARAELVPLLADGDAGVRLAALLAVGPVTEDAPAVVGPEAVFPLLHDADAEVRALATDVLRGRGLSLAQLSLARQLTHPDPAERLRLLTDLTRTETVKDAGPWLERLSRDADPAVRLGAARVACELELEFTGWLDRLAASDPDGTVRRWAGYYQRQCAAVRQTGHAR
jgi:HEAT repeat protein